MATKPKPRNTYSPSLKVVSPTGEGRAQQQFKDDCDINVIMRRMLKDKALDHVSKYQPQYGFASGLDFHQAMNIVTQGQSIFDHLPSNIRNYFQNSPARFLDFVDDPNNFEQAEELGIALSPAAALAAAELQEEAKRATEAASAGQEVQPAATDATTS